MNICLTNEYICSILIQNATFDLDWAYCAVQTYQRSSKCSLWQVTNSPNWPGKLELGTCFFQLFVWKNEQFIKKAQNKNKGQISSFAMNKKMTKNKYLFSKMSNRSEEQTVLFKERQTICLFLKNISN